LKRTSFKERGAIWIRVWTPPASIDNSEPDLYSVIQMKSSPFTENFRNLSKMPRSGLKKKAALAAALMYIGFTLAVYLSPAFPIALRPFHWLITAGRFNRLYLSTVVDEDNTGSEKICKFFLLYPFLLDFSLDKPKLNFPPDIVVVRKLPKIPSSDPRSPPYGRV